MTLASVSHMVSSNQDATGDNVQATKSKDQHQGPLLVHRQLARPDGLHGQQEDDNVGGDGVACVGVPVLGQADARRVARLVPGAGDGIALPDGGRGGCNHVGDDDPDHAVAADTEPFLDKDAEIQEQD